MKQTLAAIAIVFCLLNCAVAQVTIPGTRVQFSFPSKWKYLESEKRDANTTQYLYYYSATDVVDDGDTALPFLRIVVRSNYSSQLTDFVYDRYMQAPYQPLDDYSQGLGLPRSGGMGYVGAYTHPKDKRDYQFRMVYFMVPNAIVEFRLETTRATYSQMEKEFTTILQSLTFAN